MDTQGATGVATAILLLSLILIGATAASVIMGEPGKSNSEENYEEILNEALDEISTYIQIKDILGKYYPIEEDQRIQKIAILIKPLFSTDIDISKLMIKINNGKQIKILYYNNHAELISSNSLFEHPIWDNMTDTNFGLIVVLDSDKSIIDYDTINDNTDMTYIIFKLPPDFTMNKGDNLEVTLLPLPGIKKTLYLKAPLPINQIVSLN